MAFCPICKTSANEEQPSGGDYRRVDCRRCGKYQITGTALSMLESRLAGADKKSIAKLSHSTRSMTSGTDAKWPEINSVNLDEMLKQPLPPIDRQVMNLLVWAAAQLEDDQLGAVELPDEDDLTAVVGTIDGERVQAIIELAVNERLIEYVPDDCISISTKGWARLTPGPKPDPSPQSPEAQTPVTAVDRIVKAHCNRCRSVTKSWVRAEHTVQKDSGPISWSDTFEVIECCGCETLSVRHEYWFSEWDEMDYDDQGRMVMRPGIKETYFPAPTVRPKPDWADEITDDVLRSVMDELYSALNAGLNILASIGARTLLDRAGYLRINDPKGGFEGKLKELEKAGYISATEKTALDAVADAGNASAHRGYTPNAARLGHIVDIIENFLHRSFVLNLAAEEIRKSTPPRK